MKEESTDMGDIFEVIIYKMLYFIAWLVFNVIHILREEYSVRRKKVMAKRIH